jgi:hypothetical protein
MVFFEEQLYAAAGEKCNGSSTHKATCNARNPDDGSQKSKGRTPFILPFP